MSRITPVGNLANAVNAKGIVPPLLRAMSRITFCAAMAQFESEIEAVNVPNGDYEDEIQLAIDNWEIVIRHGYWDDSVVEEIEKVSAQFRDLKISVSTESREILRQNLMQMIKNIASLGVRVDTAGFGLAYPENTDAGKGL